MNGEPLSKPDVRLAWFELPAVDTALAPTVRLAHKVDGQAKLPAHHAPALLVSYYYVEPFLKNRESYCYRDWVMDSGAFSAHNSGVQIDLSRYVDKCLELMETDKTMVEVFSLDVIPADHKPATVQRAAEQSLKNCEDMWRQGVPAIPTFHRGEQEEFLYAMAKTYPKIGIGGVAMLRGDQKRLFCEQVFARVWPKKIHGLGMSSEELIYGLPFHSVDATNWEIAPCAFGNWQKFGKMSVRGSNQDLRSQVKHYLEVEAKARVRWANEMALLETLAPSPAVLGPTVRLVANANAGREDAKAQAFSVGASSASRTAGAPALDAGAADGQRVAGAIGKPSRKKSAPETAAAPVGELDGRWVDYWKNRL